MIDTTAAVEPDIADALEAIYRDITRLLDRIIQSVTVEVPYEFKR